MAELSAQQQLLLQKAKDFYPNHDGAVGVFQADGIPEALLKSGVEGGPWGGAQRGGFPRGEGWGFTSGGPSQGNVATHVEGHAAAVMWQRNLKVATLVVDREMCGICSRDISQALPPGATLFVISEAEGRTIIRSSHALDERPPSIAPISGGRGGTGERPSARPVRAPDVQGIAMALDLAWRWAEQQSMQDVFARAWSELLEREHEIIRKQRENPAYPIFIEIYYKIFNENNPHLYKIYQYLGRADISNGVGGFPRGHTSLWDSNQHRYLLVIPALLNDLTKSRPAISEPTTWRSGYTYVVGALVGDRTTGGDAIAALRILNGSPMYDILPILMTLKANNSFLFNKLQQALSWPTANVGVDRLRAAFFAVELSSNTGNAFNYYKAGCPEFRQLPEDQQKAVEQFLSGKAEKRDEASAEIERMAAEEAIRLLPGTWDVWIGDKGQGWNGLFKFTAKGGASWAEKETPSRETSGTWSVTKGRLSWKFTSVGDFRTFVVKLPLRRYDAKGVILPDGQGWFSMSKA